MNKNLAVDGLTYGKAVITLKQGLFGAGVAKPGNAHALRACGPLGLKGSNPFPGASFAKGAIRREPGKPRPPVFSWMGGSGENLLSKDT